MDIYITLAVEDSLSEAVARKILYQSDNNYHVTVCLGLKGSGYLKAKINIQFIATVMPQMTTLWKPHSEISKHQLDLRYKTTLALIPL